MASIGYIDGSTCVCGCCAGFNCNAINVGNTTVSSCYNCNSALCQSTYYSTCADANTITASCVSGSSSSSSSSSSASSSQHQGSRGLFKPTSNTLTVAIVSFSISIYWKIK
ncbi:unnamed protein product [Rotaria socialis]|uniref:Uncharacterized protein n=1 Tax=Rotaria socialis TaxID=392032 RepID=A0A818Z1D2_9BILA|nr:unnamed protein product [Rotaria socialis]